MSATTHERPILFSGPMVRAILDGRKTQTRRVIKPQPAGVEYYLHGERSDSRTGLPTMNDGDGRNWAMCGPFTCQYINPASFAGMHGVLFNRDKDDTELHHSKLWARETWAETESDGGPVVAYRAGGYLMHGTTGEERLGTLRNETFPGEAGAVYPPERWRPSIFMPRWASRITLEIVSVRVERVQEISREDAVLEGIDRRESLVTPGNTVYRDYQAEDEWFDRPKESFRSLWGSINAERDGGAYSWEANPFVWVIAFKRIAQA